MALVFFEAQTAPLLSMMNPCMLLDARYASASAGWHEEGRFYRCVDGKGVIADHGHAPVKQAGQTRFGVEQMVVAPVVFNKKPLVVHRQTKKTQASA
jgi:hypothetical protein